MNDAGKLFFEVIREDTSVHGIRIRSSRPHVSRLLVGKSVAEVLHLVSLLFSVCGLAQSAAARAAIKVAQRGILSSSVSADHEVACEAMQEHLWRLMLDWPKLLGLEPQRELFAEWHGKVRDTGTGNAGMGELLRAFEQDWLGLPITKWTAFSEYRALADWWVESASPAALLFSALADQDAGRNGGEPRLFSVASAAQAYQAFDEQMGTDISALPEWQGKPAETGAWAYYSDMTLLRDVYRQHRSKALTRLLARVIDLVELMNGTALPRLDATSAVAGEGISAVRTARGILMHRVRVDHDRVTDYTIVAPTEWNFHPRGVLAQQASDLGGCDMNRVEHSINIDILSLDPCVPHEIVMRHA